MVTIFVFTSNGGTLAYANSAAGEDATGYDISSRVNVGDGGFLNVSVLGAGDTVSWAGLSADVMGAGTTLTKTGAGTLALGYAGNTLAHLTVEEGTLAFTGGATIGVNPNNATIVRVSEGASLALSGGTVNLHAQLNGAGTVTIGTADTAGLVNISNTGNTNFTGRLELVGNGVNMNTNANWVAFGAGNTLGGGTVFIDGKGFHFSAGTTAANFEIGATHGAMQNGSSGATEDFTISALFPVALIARQSLVLKKNTRKTITMATAMKATTISPLPFSGVLFNVSFIMENTVSVLFILIREEPPITAIFTE